MEVPKQAEISLRLYHDMKLMLAYSLETDGEVGGLLIMGLHGNFGVVAEQFGEDREIVLEPNEDLYEGESYWGTVHCIVPNTLLLGDNKLVEDYSVGDIVTGRTGLVSVDYNNKHHYKGKIMRIKGQGLLPFEVTPNHPILVSSVNTGHHSHVPSFTIPYWKFSSELVAKHRGQGGDYLLVPRIQGSIDVKNVSVREYIGHNKFGGNKEYCSKLTELPLTEETAWVLGLYVAEGSSYKRIDYSLNVNEIDYQTKLLSIYKRLGYSGSINKREDNGCVVHIYSRVLAKAFKSWCGESAKTKKIPDFILYHKNIKILSAFLNGYECGDGYKTNNGVGITTVSKVLATQLQFAYSRVGKVASISCRDRSNAISKIKNRIIKHGISYEIWVPDNTTKYSKAKIDENYLYIPIRELESKDYDGTVYDIGTKDNTFLINNVVTHNTHPITDTASTGDVDGYLSDPDEIVMIVTGADESINCMVKTQQTQLGETDVKEEGYQQEDMVKIAEDKGFLFYRGSKEDETILTLQTTKVGQESLEVVDEKWKLEDLVVDLGHQGLSILPEGYATKKDTKDNEIQTLMFDKEKFSRQEALDWAKKHEFKSYTIRETDNNWRVRQFNPSKCKSDGKTIDMSDGIKAYMCPT